MTDPNAPGASLTAAAINDNGDIAGFYTSPATGNTDGFLKYHGKFIDLAVPGASSTMALGVNDHDEVVGIYTVGSGSAAAMHGFTWTPGRGFITFDDPHGVGTTTINGVNNAGDLVGFYVDATATPTASWPPRCTRANSQPAAGAAAAPAQDLPGRGGCVCAETRDRSPMALALKM